MARCLLPSMPVWAAAAIAASNAYAVGAETAAEATAPAVEALEEVIYVYGTRERYREEETGSATRTPTPIEQLPQSVFVVTRDVIDDQAMTGLGDLVRYVPGVTMGQGEGHRDAPVFRGNLTTSDFFVDGMRDDLQYLRDLYNVERVDVLKGASALVFGRGTGGGALNRVTKHANGDRVRGLDLLLGTDGQSRLAADLSDQMGERLAGRVNLVIEESDSYRDEVEIARHGISPALSVDLSESTRLDLFGEYFSDERTVDRGVPSLGGRPWKGPTGTFFGNPSISDSDIEVLTGRGVVSHDLGHGLSLRAALSYGDYSKFYANVYPGGAVDPVTSSSRISSYLSATDRQNLLAQADLVWQGAWMGVDHTLLFGLEAGRQRSSNLRINTASGIFSIDDRGRDFVPDFSLPPALDNENNLDLLAVLVQDQIALTPTMHAVVGLRWDRFDLDFDDRRSGTADYTRRDEFVSPRMGLVWEPLPGWSVYGGWSKAFLPQSGEQFSSLDATRAALAPEEFENVEVGLRWQPSSGLLLSAALYRLDRTNTVAPGAIPGSTVLTGSQRSEGVEISLQGELRKGWHVIGAMAVQDAEITSTTTAAPAGRKAPLVPEFSASLWNRVQLSPKFDLALGIVHQGEQFASITNAVLLPSYTRLDAALFYFLSDNLDVQLNVENLTDQRYWFTAHNDNNITPGSGISARLTLSARF